MHKLYAQAIYIAAQKDGADAKKLVKQLTEALKDRGRLKLLPSILRELERIEAREAKLAPQLEVSSESEAARALKEAAAQGIHAVHARVNDALIRGWRASANGKLIDHSAKRELVELYRKVTTP
ncbi:MAG: F0F1 ATP synthase subunit delta [Candidatus Pacebacteria bacterium]|nr:F0F1 ATP synthase subunit delta [Candidatus Paceibacterota bacterium]